MKKKLQQQLKAMACYGLIGIFLQCLLLNMALASDGNPQDPESIRDILVDVSGKDMRLKEVFKNIEKQTSFEFSYDAAFVDDTERISINMIHQPLINVLTQIAKEKYMSFKRVDNTIFIKKAKEEGEVEEVVMTAIEIKGKVTSLASGESLPGVNVLVKGSSTGTVTDIEGKYSINVPNDDDILVFSFIGYVTQEVPVNGRTTIDVAMVEDVQSLEEVVVVGYGTQKQVNVIGSVTTVDSEALTVAPVTNISNALAGRLPGAIVQQRSGEPGKDAASILIRGSATLGNSAPLVVIDGIPGRDLNSVNPNDVESITVLKDASAAIYGARAANGVILVTTKSGKEDAPATFSYGFYEGFLSPTMLPEMADAPTYAQMIREMQSYRGIDEANMTFSLEDIEKYKSGEYPWTHPNTNWYEAALADHSTDRRHNFSVSGGTQSVKYYGSFSKQFNDGIYKNSATSYNRYNLIANVDVEINEFLSVGLNIIGSQENRMYSTKSSSSIFSSLMRSYPTSAAVFPNGLPGPDIEYGDNPVVTPSFETGFDDDKRYRSNNKISATFKVPGVEGLSLSSYYAYDMFFKQRKLLQKPWTLYQLDEGAYLAADNTGKEDGSAFLVGTSKAFSEPRVTDYYDDSKTSTFNFKANYDKSINDVHNISAFVAYENSEYNGKGIEAFRRYFISDQLPYLFAGGNAEKDNFGWVDIDARENYFGRISYNYDEIYLFQFSFRRDGSLRFSEEKGRWGNFPGLLAGWRVSNEDFWQDNVGFIDFFKLKASWGQMGNDLVAPFQYLSGYVFGTGGVFGANKAYSTSLYQFGAPNPLITWEVANVYNAGFESMFFNSKMTLNADLFYQRRSDILVKRNASVPAFTGISLPDENFGIVDSKGFEIVMGYNEMQPDFSYGINGNLAFARNSVMEFDEPARNVPWQVQTGHPQGAALLYKSTGIFRDEEHVNSLPHVPGARPGDIIIEDYDGDGEITNDDRFLFDKTVNPEITYGVSFNLRYKNLELTGLVQGTGTAMRRMYNDDRQGSGGNYFQYDAEGRWTPDNINANKPRAFERTEEYWRGSHITDYSYQNTAYARLKNLQISYTIPQSIQNAVKLKNAQVYLSGQNLFLIYSKSKIMDPELVSDQSYPLMRVMALGARISF
jgi:TonB-linked SusC/RagA family outer membrane protein